MSYINICPHCRKEQLPELDTATNTTWCSMPECQEEIETNSFQKQMIKAAGQFRQQTQKFESFTVGCPECRKTGRPIHTQDGKLICSSCSKELKTLGLPYVNMLKASIPRQNHN